MKRFYIFKGLTCRYLLLIACALSPAARAGDFSISVAGMSCEGKENPMGVALHDIHFGWTLGSTGRNIAQSAYQVVISSSREKLEKGLYDVWNSRRVTSHESISVLYHGNGLRQGSIYYWRIMVWDRKGRASSWSAAGKFTTGLFGTGGWDGARWIGYETLADSMRLVPGLHAPAGGGMRDKYKERSIVPLFRKGFEVRKKVMHATVFVSGIGQYEMNINGRKVGNSFLSPGWTDYDKRCLYNVYDVTGLLQEGGNTLGLIVGNGFYHINRERYFKILVAYGYPAMICKLKIEYTDGSSDVVVSDGSWKTCPSPVSFSSIYGGEDYDARLEQKGWAAPGFDDAGWKHAQVVKGPRGKLLPEADFPITEADSIPVKKIDKIDGNTYSYDFGQNVSGIVEIRVKGRRGDTVRLTPSELVDADRRPNQRASGAPYYFTYVLHGDGVETWRPAFSYYGFRYVMVEHAELDSIVSLVSLHTRNSSPPTGSFQCSNVLFNQVNELIRWAIKSNMQSVITDCPHREKLGWLEQDYLMGTSIQYNYNIRLLYKSIVMDMMDAQTSAGLVPDIAPEYVHFESGFRDSPEWGSASVILPWLLYTWYGDKETMRTAYDMMKKYVNYLERKSDKHILNYGLGDWYDYGPGFPGEAQLTPRSLTATAIYYYDVDLMAEIARLLGHSRDAIVYESRAHAIRTAFNKAFFNAKDKVYSTGSQTAMAMPLCVGLVDPADQPAVVKNMIDSIRVSGYKLTAGDIGFHFLIRALSDNHGDETIYAMNDRKDVPGYGFQLEKGATALTESWPALAEVSNNHLMLGHIMEWFYEGIGGIKQAKNSTAYQEVVIDPATVNGLTSATVRYVSPYGTIGSAWKKEGNHFRIKVEIPVSTKATVYLPSMKMRSLQEGGHAAAGNKDLIVKAGSDGKTMVTVGSGVYDLEIEL